MIGRELIRKLYYFGLTTTDMSKNRIGFRNVCSDNAAGVIRISQPLGQDLRRGLRMQFCCWQQLNGTKAVDGIITGLM